MSKAFHSSFATTPPRPIAATASPSMEARTPTLNWLPLGSGRSPTDIARYAIEADCSVNGNANHVLSPDMTKQMLTAGMGHWGLGLEIGGSDSNRYFAHGGDNAGFHNNFVMYEKGGNGFVVMTNGDNGNLWPTRSA